MDDYVYTLVIHEDVQKFLNVQKLEDIFLIDDDVNPPPKVNVRVEKFTGERTDPLYYFLNMSGIYGVKTLMIPKKDYAHIKMRL